MSKPAIVVENLGKQYKIGLREKADRTFREAIVDTLAAPFRRLRTLGEKSVGDDTIWALRDVSFEVQPGEVVGIIGPNGAGKTTLLKILSRITEPTEGQARLRGRVGSLLEVGTGFHRELTGRENVYLNGAILGMGKTEITRKFDEIVDFAGVEKFIDTPIKRYSSGMYVRLAFAVAAHLEPEILLVDEVLAVGDVAFQKKCLGKMGDVAKQGRTVLFVSHNIGAIADLCPRTILLQNGRIIAHGGSKEVIRAYIGERDSAKGHVDLRDSRHDQRVRGPMRVTFVQTEDQNGQVRSRFEYGRPIVFRFGVSAKAGAMCIVGLSVFDSLSRMVLHMNNVPDDATELVAPGDESEVRLVVNNIFNNGKYYVTVWLGDGFNLENDCVRNCLSFEVDSTAHGRTNSQSAVRLPGMWSIKGRS